MYNITEVHYRDIYGKLIWKDNIVFRSLWGVGNELVHDSKNYIVRRVAVADEIQHVNIELVDNGAVEQGVQSDLAKRDRVRVATNELGDLVFIFDEDTPSR